MTQKRKRKKPQAARKAEVVVKEPPEQQKAPAKGRAGIRMTESPFPALGPSLAAGFRAAGSSPAILAVAFVSLLLTWAAFVIVGDDAGPRTMSLLMSASPVHVFSDVPVALGRGSAGASTLATMAAFTALRSITFGILTLLTVQALREGKAPFSDALRALPRVLLPLVVIYLIEFGMVVAAFQLLVGFLGQLAILSIAAGIYFLVFAPIVAVAEGVRPMEALKRGLRAARLPGMRHLSLVLAYFLLLFYSGAIAPFGVLTPATPSIGAWAYSLAWTFIHVSVLGAFAFRWLAVRDQVASGPVVRED